MRELTDAEYRTLLAVLSYPEENEQSRIRRSGLPSSTYHVAKRRLYELGWASDRWVPQPGPLGLGGVEIVLSRPFSGDRGPLEAKLQEDPTCVLLWSGVHCMLSVRFLRSESAPSGKRAARRAPSELARLEVLRDDPMAMLPVYFDYAGLWAHFGSEAPPKGYPRGLDLRSPAVPAQERRAALHALRRGNEPEAPWTARRWTSLLRLPRSQRRAVQRGTIAAWTFPQLSQIPPMDGRRIGEVIFVVGSHLKGGPTDLLNALTKDCRAFPFLFASAGGRTLLGGVGQTSATSPGRVTLRSARRPVLGVVHQHLEQVEVLIEPVESLRAVVSHRYGRSVEDLSEADERPMTAPTSRGLAES